MATSKMENIEKLEDEMTRASLVLCQAVSHVSKRSVVPPTRKQYLLLMF